MARLVVYRIVNSHHVSELILITLCVLIVKVCHVKQINIIIIIIIIIIIKHGSNN